MASSKIEFELTITEAGADAETLDRLTGRLMGDLRELGVDSAERPSDGTAPAGVKGDPFTLGALGIVAVRAIAPRLVGFLQAWALRGESREVKIKTPAGVEVEFTSKNKLTEEELVALVEKLTLIQG